MNKEKSMNRITKITILFIVLNFINFLAYSQKGLDKYAEGKILIQKQNIDSASIIFSQGIGFNDIAKSVNFYGRAFCYYELNFLDKAKSDLDSSLVTESVNEHSINSDIYWLKGLIAAKENKKDDEFSFYEVAMRYAPENLWLKTNFGLILIEHEEFDKAIKLLSQVIKQNNEEPYALNNRALAYLKLDKIVKAKKDLDRSKEIDPNNPFLYKNYFLYYKITNELDKACESIEVANSKNILDYGTNKDVQEFIKLEQQNCEK